MRVELNQAATNSPSPSRPQAAAPEAAPHPVDYHSVDFNQEISNRDVNETAADAQLIKDLGRKARMHAEEDVSQLNGAIPTTEQLKGEFDKLASNHDIPFKYITDGCYARAHVMCDEMHKDDVNCSKMWVMVNHRKNYLAAKNEYLEANWHGFHVAPMVYARDDKTQQVQPYLMDPSIADHPLHPEEWVHDIWDGKAPIHLDVTPDAQYGRLESFGQQTDFQAGLEPARESLKTFAEVQARMEANSKP